MARLPAGADFAFSVPLALSRCLTARGAGDGLWPGAEASRLPPPIRREPPKGGDRPFPADRVRPPFRRLTAHGTAPTPGAPDAGHKRGRHASHSTAGHAGCPTPAPVVTSARQAIPRDVSTRTLPRDDGPICPCPVCVHLHLRRLRAEDAACFGSAGTCGVGSRAGTRKSSRQVRGARPGQRGRQVGY